VVGFGGVALAGENRAVLLTGEQCFIGVRGFLGDLATICLAGDCSLTGEQSKSSSCCVVMRLGLFVGKRVLVLLVGVGTSDCLLGDLAGVLDLGAGFEGDRKRWLEAFEGVLDKG